MVQRRRRGGLRGEAWKGERAEDMYRASSLAGPPAKGAASSCSMMALETLSTSLMSARFWMGMKRQSDPGAVSRPY
jgi:hypothetical protein